MEGHRIYRDFCPRQNPKVLGKDATRPTTNSVLKLHQGDPQNQGKQGQGTVPTVPVPGSGSVPGDPDGSVGLVSTVTSLHGGNFDMFSSFSLLGGGRMGRRCLQQGEGGWVHLKVGTLRLSLLQT